MWNERNDRALARQAHARALNSTLPSGRVPLHAHLCTAPSKRVLVDETLEIEFLIQLTQLYSGVCLFGLFLLRNLPVMYF